jgi:hypothetical protein
MYPRVLVFVAISAFLIAAIYSWSLSEVFAVKITFACSSLKDHDGYYCANTKTKEVILCIKTKKGYDCEYLPRSPTDTNLPSDLKNALGATIQESGNTTKAPNTSVLNGNILAEENNTNNDNVKEPKAPKVPENLGGLNDNASQ